MTTITRSMKENNGKAARRQCWQRLGMIAMAVALVAVMVVIGLLVYRAAKDEEGQSNKRHGRHAHSHGHSKFGSSALPQRHQRIHHNTQTHGDLEQEQRRNNEDDTLPRRKQLLRDGHYQLVDLDWGHEQHFQIHTDGSYRGIRGHFCQLHWSSHKADPSTTPMFRDVLAQSKDDCHDPLILDLAETVAELRESDQSNNSVHTLAIGGLVFHESRCGSTLVANLLQAVHPAAHRVYSESQPPLTVLRMSDSYPDDKNGAHLSTLLQDVLYLMARSNDPAETHVFFKIQSIGSRHIQVATQALPDVPWMFVYREGVQILMSHFAAGPHHVQRANCARSFHRPPAIVQQRLEQQAGSDGTDISKVSMEAYCAAHFATLTENAVQQLQVPHSLGRAVDYTQLPDILWTDILPHWNIPLDEADIVRMQQVAQQYSKGRGERAGMVFEGDTQTKQDKAWPAVQEAAQTYLQSSYEILQALSAAAAKQ